MAERIEIVVGDITRLAVDIIVNAANELMMGGGGVDGAIHRAAGPALLVECMAIGPCPTGETRITGAYKLPADHVIHTVGPVWHGGDYNEDNLLANCYRNSMELAAKKSARTLGFPAISTGVFAFPKTRAAGIAVNEVHTFMNVDSSLETVVFCCFDETSADLHRAALKAL